MFGMFRICPLFWICLWFWMCQGCEYTRVLNVPLVLNTPVFWIYQVPTESLICLNMLNMPEYVKISGNIPRSGWMAFVLHVSIVIPCLRVSHRHFSGGGSIAPIVVGTWSKRWGEKLATSGGAVCIISCQHTSIYNSLPDSFVLVPHLYWKEGWKPQLNLNTGIC